MKKSALRFLKLIYLQAVMLQAGWQLGEVILTENTMQVDRYLTKVVNFKSACEKFDEL